MARIRQSMTAMAASADQASDAATNAANWLSLFLQEGLEQLADFEEHGIMIEAHVLIKPAPQPDAD